MRKFFSYAFGLIWRPVETLPQIVAEPNKRLMIFYAIIWNNVLLLIFIGIVTIHRLFTYDIYSFKPLFPIIVDCTIFILISNLILLVPAIIHYIYLQHMKKEHDVQPSMLYSYLYMSILILLLNISAIVYHFLFPTPNHYDYYRDITEAPFFRYKFISAIVTFTISLILLFRVRSRFYSPKFILWALFIVGIVYAIIRDVILIL